MYTLTHRTNFRNEKKSNRNIYFLFWVEMLARVWHNLPTWFFFLALSKCMLLKSQLPREYMWVFFFHPSRLDRVVRVCVFSISYFDNNDALRWRCEEIAYFILWNWFAQNFGSLFLSIRTCAQRMVSFFFSTFFAHCLWPNKRMK